MFIRTCPHPLVLTPPTHPPSSAGNLALPGACLQMILLDLRAGPPRWPLRRLSIPEASLTCVTIARTSPGGPIRALDSYLEKTPMPKTQPAQKEFEKRNLLKFPGSGSTVRSALETSRTTSEVRGRHFCLQLAFKKKKKAILPFFIKKCDYFLGTSRKCSVPKPSSTYFLEKKFTHLAL